MRKFIDWALVRYQVSDITIQMKARFFLGLCLALMILIPIVAGSAMYISWATNRSWAPVDPRLYVNYTLVYLFAILSFVLLIRGYFYLSVHLIVISVMVSVLVSIILERTDPVCRLDSVVLIVAILAITPMIVSQSRVVIFIYGCIALAALYFFIHVFRSEQFLEDYVVVDYLIDNTVAIVFVTLSAFVFYTINNVALSRARTEIQERIRSEEEKSKLEAQLLHALRMESIGRLAGGVAHDFNNLLTAILGNTTLVMMDLPEDGAEYSRLNVVLQASQSAAELTQQLLAFSRKQIIEPKIIDPAKEIGKMRGLLTRLIGENIKIEINTDSADGVIKADTSQLEQILLNLVVNARDAMPDGGNIYLEVSTTVLDESFVERHPYCVPGQHVMISVSDTGTGIPPEVQQHLFEPFFTTKVQGKGTGLGLATVYGAVRQNGGSIDVYSEPGRGTTFKIYFPKLRDDGGESSEEIIVSYELPTGTETIMLVEDSPIVLSFAQEILQNLGYTIISALNGEEALAIASRCSHIHLLITDVIMPGMNGRILADRLLAERPDMKVLFASGYTADAIVHHGLLDGGINFINKPYSTYTLAQKIREVMGK